MEKWDILDWNGNKTGETIERGISLKNNQYHLSVHVWIMNDQGKFLITKRTPNKTFPNMWETTGGAAVAGDTSLQAALREVKEEIGVDLYSEKAKLLFNFRRDYVPYPDFLDVWLFKKNINLDHLVYQPDEVCDAKWACVDQINKMIEIGEFVDTFYYLDDLFALVSKD